MLIKYYDDSIESSLSKGEKMAIAQKYARCIENGSKSTSIAVKECNKKSKMSNINDLWVILVAAKGTQKVLKSVLSVNDVSGCFLLNNGGLTRN